MIVAKLPPRHSAIMDMVYLRDRVMDVEEVNDQARQTIEKLDAIVEKLRSPAFRVGTLLMLVEPDKAHICVSGTDYVCRVDPQIPMPSLQVGQRVLLNEAFAIVQDWDSTVTVPSFALMNCCRADDCASGRSRV